MKTREEFLNLIEDNNVSPQDAIVALLLDIRELLLKQEVRSEQWGKRLNVDTLPV